MLLAVALRLVNVAWGLPSALDPDEPLFIVLALKLLAGPTLDPGWFGHPGTTTIYVTALVEAASLALARLSGDAESGRAWALGLFQDPTAVFVAARCVFVLFAGGCVAMTWRIARRLWDRPTAAAAALLLALNPLHIAWSQVIRTDIQASFFMLLSLASCLDVAERGRGRDHLRAALWAGAAIATKWPAAAVLVAVAGAAMLAPGRSRTARAARAAASIAGAALALLAISPFLLLDHATATANLTGEAQASHLGATGGGFLHNVGYYLTGPVAASFGWPAMIAAAAGLAVALRRARPALVVVAPLAAFVIAVSSQGLIWERWIVPALPLFAILAGAGLVAAARAVAGSAERRGRAATAAVLAAIVLLPVALGTAAQIRERRNDTRILAERWLHDHGAPGARVLVEYPALSLLATRLEFLYPAGTIGCIDGRRTLSGTVKLPAVDAVRGGRAILDIGTIAPDRLGACPADIAMFSDYDRYLLESGQYPGEIAIYRRFLARGRTVAVFSPEPGRSGGPVVRIVALRAGAVR